MLSCYSNSLRTFAWDGLSLSNKGFNTIIRDPKASNPEATAESTHLEVDDRGNSVSIKKKMYYVRERLSSATIFSHI
jgi:hypothetical protein